MKHVCIRNNAKALNIQGCAGTGGVYVKQDTFPSIISVTKVGTYFVFGQFIFAKHHVEDLPYSAKRVYV